MFINIENISKAYHSVMGANREVLSKLNLQVEKGEHIAIIGPSGSGKTTLLNIIGTLDKPDSGSVTIAGKDISKYAEKELALFRNESIGFIFQQHHLLPQCTLLENILIPTIPLKDSSKKKSASQRGEELLKMVGIYEQRFQKPGELSGGECQRAAVVRALINSPSLLLADEPTGALDKKNSDTLSNLLLEINKDENTTLIMVTHDTKLADKADRVFSLTSGKLKQKGEFRS